MCKAIAVILYLKAKNRNILLLEVGQDVIYFLEEETL